jgi:hypothetical protein
MYDNSSEEEVQEVILVQRPRNFRLKTFFNSMLNMNSTKDFD